MRQAETLTERFEAAKDEVQKLRGRIDSQGERSIVLSAADKKGQNEDVANLKFEKEALQTKLRKYVTYCKNLQTDKEQILDVLRSRKRDVMDDDFAGAVVSLCDELTSLEEENEALSNIEGKASSYLTEVERLRQENELVQADMKEAQQRISTLTRSEAELNQKIQAAKDKISSLREERESLKSRVNGESNDGRGHRKVKFLEEENLKLHQDLKTTKKQLQNTKSQLDVLQMRGIAMDDDTEDLSPFRQELESTEEKNRNEPQEQRKELGESAFKSPDGKENGVNSIPKSAVKSAFKPSRKEVKSSAKKRRFAQANLNSSTPCRKQRREISRSVGLGEPGPGDDENTAECRQS